VSQENVEIAIGLIASLAKGQVTHFRTYASAAEALEAAGLRE
jgi:hypothetical protein